jgi:hypothetical protein
LSFEPRTPIRLAQRHSLGTPFLAHSKFHHYPPRRLILGAALRENPMQAEGVKRKLQQRLADFGREALTRVT